MPRTVRTAAVTAPALAVVAVAWLRLEHPFVPLWRVLALLGLALAAAAPQRWIWRAAAAVVATAVAAWVAVGVSLVPTHPLDPGSGFGLAGSFAVLGRRFGDGFTDFYGTHLPFDPRVHVAMSNLVLTGVFCFALLVAVLAAARRPVAGALALLAGAGWPATLLGPSHGVAVGAAILAAALFLLAGLGSRRVPSLALPATAVLAVGAVAVGSATAARHGLVHWQSWNPTHAAGGPVGVGFVWNAQYGGLDWPAHPTVVLRVQAAQTPAYLRATVLDDFAGDAWSTGVSRPADALEPAAALQPRNELREDVTVEALADTHLVGGSVPVRFAAGGAPLDEPERGFASLPEGLPPGFRYTVWSYAPRPTAAELRKSAPEYPPVLAEEGLLDVGQDTTMPAFGTPHRAETALTLRTRNPALNPYEPLARLAEEVAGSARTPYDAAARLEHWFVSSGGFRYSNRPTVIGPPLVGFVTTTRAGYCQYFAGAMALMLRYLGIPARVAVGFAGGTATKSQDAWLVTDRDAHAWVEVWFKGYGWLPFDPTPAAPGAAARPLPAGTGPAAGTSPGPLRFNFHQGTTKGGSANLAEGLRRANDFLRRHPRASSTAAAAPTGHGAGRSRAVLLLLLAVAFATGGIVLAKLGVRLVRRAARDPRRVARACRQELAGFLADQRIDVGGSATLHELGDLVRYEFGVEPSRFVAAATAARFGRADRAGAAAHDARRELRALVRAMRLGLTRGDRLRGLFSLRSLGRPSSGVAGSASLGTGIMGSTGS